MKDYSEFTIFAGAYVPPLAYNGPFYDPRSLLSTSSSDSAAMGGMIPCSSQLFRTGDHPNDQHLLPGCGTIVIYEKDQLYLTGL